MTEISLSEHVPSSYSFTCYCHVKALAIQHVADVVVVCTSKGVIIEFSKKHVLKTCEIKKCIPENVDFFVRYRPYCVFYIVKSKSDVYIVERNEYLKVSHVFNNVEKVQKYDFSKIGSPQIGIWYCNQQTSEVPHFVTDLSSTEQKTSPIRDEFTSLLNERLKTVRLKCAQMKENLVEMKKMRYQQTQMLIQNHLKQEEDQLEDDLRMVTLLGESTSCRKEIKPFSPGLEFKRIWRKVHNDNLIIGVEVVNKDPSPIINVSLVLKFQDSKDMSYKTAFYTHHEFCNATTLDKSFRTLDKQWKSVDVLHTDVTAYAVAVLNLSTILSYRRSIIHGVIMYNIENRTSQEFHQLSIPDIEMCVEDVVGNSLAVFQMLKQNAHTVNEEDLLSVLVSSQTFEFVVSEPVAEILTLKFGFVTLSDVGRLYHTGNEISYLSKVFVETWHSFGNEYHLVIYTCNFMQALSLVNCLQSALPHNTSIDRYVDNKLFDLQGMYKALESEINFTSKQLNEWEGKYYVSGGIIHVPKNEYFTFRTSAFDIEKETDESDV